MKKIFLSSFVLLLLISCNDKKSPEQGLAYQTVKVSLSLDVDDSYVTVGKTPIGGVTPTTRTVTNDPVTALEQQIDSVWVLQFSDQEGTLLSKSYVQYEKIGAETDSSAAVNLVPAVASTLYIVANVDTALFKDLTNTYTQADFLVSSIPTANVITSADGDILQPMIGTKSLSATDILLDAQVVNINDIAMSRLYSKVTYIYDIIEADINDLKITSVYLCNSPTEIPLTPALANLSGNIGLGDKVDLSLINGVDHNSTGTTIGDAEKLKDSIVFYLPQNIGGVNTSPTLPYKDGVATVFTDLSSTLAYLVLEAEYGTTDVQQIYFKVYLGVDDHSNYNVLSNYHYKYETEITETGLGVHENVNVIVPTVNDHLQPSPGASAP